MKTLYFYIGQPTTSGSSLNFFLSKNADILNKNGIGFPKLVNIKDMYNEHLVFDENEPGIIMKKSIMNQIDIDKEVKTNEFRDERKQILKNMCEKYDNVILADETFYQFASNNDVLRNFREAAENIGFDKVIFVLFLRRQDRYMHSLYIENLLSGKEYRTFDEFIKQTINETSLLDYHNTITQIEQIYGQDSLRIAQYNEKRENIVRRFFEICRLPFPNEAQAVLTKKPLHMSLHHCEAKRMINIMTNALNLRYLLTEITQRCKLYFNIFTVSYQPFISKRQLQEVLNHYMNGNNAIFNRYELPPFDLSDIENMEDEYDNTIDSNSLMPIIRDMLKMNNHV